MTKILSWNVNSLRIRLAELERIAREENPDVVCLQEVKAKEEDFPFAAVKAAGFEHIALYGMAGYNGVAILSRRPLTGVRRFDWAGKADARHISAVTEEGIEIHNIYIPAGATCPIRPPTRPLPASWLLLKNWTPILPAAKPKEQHEKCSSAAILTSPRRKTTSGTTNSF